MIKFLEDRRHLQERVNAGIDLHPTDDECKEFERLASILSPKTDFSWRGCVSCVNTLVKFVFDNEDRIVTRIGKVKFPANDSKASEADKV